MKVFEKGSAKWLNTLFPLSILESPKITENMLLRIEKLNSLQKQSLMCWVKPSVDCFSQIIVYHFTGRRWFIKNNINSMSNQTKQDKSFNAVFAYITFRHYFHQKHIKNVTRVQMSKIENRIFHDLERDFVDISSSLSLYRIQKYTILYPNI